MRFKSCKVKVKKRYPQRNFWLLKTANNTNTQKFDFEKLKNIQIFGLQFVKHKNWKKYLSQQVTVWGSLPWNFLFGSLYVQYGAGQGGGTTDHFVTPHLS